MSLDRISDREDEQIREALGKIRDEINRVGYDAGVAPDRIRLTEMVPPGTLFTAPYDRFGVTRPERRLTDGGTIEVLMHPDDWKVMVEEGKRQAKRYSGPPVPVERFVPPRLAPGSPRATVFGIPVIDDTIPERMARDDG